MIVSRLIHQNFVRFRVEDKPAPSRGGQIIPHKRDIFEDPLLQLKMDDRKGKSSVDALLGPRQFHPERVELVINKVGSKAGRSMTKSCGLASHRLY
jgi:hypothetical protein